MGTLHCWVSIAEKKKETLLAFNHGQAFDGAPHLGDPSQAGWFFCRRNSWKLPSSGIYYHFGNPFTCPILRGQFTHRGPSFQEGTVPRRSATRKWLLLPPPQMATLLDSQLPDTPSCGPCDKAATTPRYTNTPALSWQSQPDLFLLIDGFPGERTPDDR